MKTRSNIRIQGLIRAAERFHHQVNFEAAQEKADKNRLRRELTLLCGELDSILDKNRIQPGNLPAQSRRAALWFFFLRREDHLSAHLKSTQQIQFACNKRYRSLNNAPLIKFYNSNILYQVKHRDHSFEFILHEGYLNAPKEIQSLLISLPGRKRMSKKTRSILREHSHSEQFRKIQIQLNQHSIALYRESDAIGRFYHLKEAFERVNSAYFKGQHSLPHLCWSTRVTRRKFGHYNPTTDSIQLSRTLDGKNIPEYVIDFVLYHELLHRDLGFLEKNGRQYAHRTEFRQRELAFSQYEKAQTFLDRLASILK
ncbi:MAG: hypothetical protein J7K85_01330 [Anaerolineaceae bacterium]|nr:hypothetical protein [Anaerolineaceae bacterium]